MDNTPDGVDIQEFSALNYDDTVAYEQQIPTEAEVASLAKRIGNSKVYLLSESSAATRAGKRKHNGIDDEDRIVEDEDEMDEDLAYRPNALLMTGPPIAYLPTARIFAYSTHFDAHPMGLEWVDDNTCVLVFESIKTAREAFNRLQKSASEAPDMEDLITAKPIPIAFWPPEERINQTLGKGQGLKGTIRMRWAKSDDVKKKGAKKESQFYRKHGRTAGKELFNGRDLPPPKRRRRDDSQDDERRKAELDNQLDQFLAEDEEILTNEDIQSDVPASPPSKMRSDYIAKDGRTLLERTSLIRLHSSSDLPDLASRLTAPLPRRARGGAENLGDRLRLPTSERLEWGYDEGRRQPRGRNERDLELLSGSDGHLKQRRWRRGGGERERPERAGGEQRSRKTQQQLDDELDAFLKSHD
ncbi:hypothetical protein BYT27DRAFT_7183480 [Phlegmacium glaucopus]|nr:hypothetical protein BYT27DRAFT_7183480 [Phlegmacium glaucopus]